VDSGSPAAIALAGAVGLLFGSFATVAAHRIPRRQTIVSGRSRCPNCSRTIRATENIPVVSYVLQRGRCKGCGARISISYPLIEVTTAVMFAMAAWKFGASAEAAVFAVFFWTLVVLSAIDLERRLLPNRVVYPAFVGGWVAILLLSLLRGTPERLADAAVGSLIFGGFFFALAFLVPAGMGGGDVKLAFVLGTFLGYLGGIGLVVVGMFLAFLSGSLVGVGIMVTNKGGRKTMVPFGPFLALGAVLSIFVGRFLLEGYLGLL
jgi:leader peptidase (prepilin peptidase) / N-methyltransferase